MAWSRTGCWRRGGDWITSGETARGHNRRGGECGERGGEGASWEKARAGQDLVVDSVGTPRSDRIGGARQGGSKAPNSAGESPLRKLSRQLRIPAALGSRTRHPQAVSASMRFADHGLDNCSRGLASHAVSPAALTRRTASTPGWSRLKRRSSGKPFGRVAVAAEPAPTFAQTAIECCATGP